MGWRRDDGKEMTPPFTEIDHPSKDAGGGGGGGGGGGNLVRFDWVTQLLEKMPFLNGDPSD